MKEVCGFQDEQGRFFATKEELLKEQDRERQHKVLVDAAVEFVSQSPFEYMPYYVVEELMKFYLESPDKYTQLLADYNGKQIRYTVMDNAQNFDIMSVVDPKTSTTIPPQVTKQQKKWYQF